MFMMKGDDMKKVTAIFLILVFMVSLCGVGFAKPADTAAKKTEPKTEPVPEEDTKKTVKQPISDLKSEPVPEGDQTLTVSV